MFSFSVCVQAKLSRNREEEATLHSSQFKGQNHFCCCGVVSRAVTVDALFNALMR